MIRPATVRDAQECAGIMRQWIAETDWFPALHTDAEDTPFILSKIDRGYVWAEETSDGIVGFMALEDDFLSCLYVARQHRGSGVGARLLTQAKQLAAHFTLWTFVANNAAQAFYLREGLVETNRTDGDNEENLPDIEFTWNGEGL